jgi:hypothetical protein
LTKPSKSSKERPAVDRVYKEDIPASRRALEELNRQFSRLDSRTDWSKLRIEPLLEHARTLERLLRSPKFSRETSRLRRGVVMFYSDLVYFRENLKALKVILKAESRSNPAKSGDPAGRRTTPVSTRNRA